MDKANTDGGEQKPSSLTGGLPTLQPSSPTPAANTPTLQKAAIQPYRRTAQSAAKHPSPSAEATDAAEAIIRDYGITN